MQKLKIVPSFLTSMNLLAGFFAILINDPTTSFYLILIGIGFDFVDGLSARLLKVPSAFGKELDSLADMVSFGVAPGFLYYHHVLRGNEQTGYVFFLYLLVATLIPVLAGLRLAKFNVKDSGKIGFAGLPSSAAALMIISVPFLLAENNQWLSVITEYDWIIIAGPVLFALLMVTNIPMFGFKNFKGGLKGNWVQLTYVVSMLPILFFFHWVAIPAGLVWYVLLSVLTISFWRKT